MKMAAFVSVVFLIVIVSCSPKSIQSPSEQTIKQAEDEITQVMHQFEAVGATYVVLKNNEVIYQNARGLKNRETEEPLTTENLFRIASISKSFSATTLMQLIEEGKIELQDDVNDYLDFSVRNPGYPDTPITIEMLLSHTSSISDKNGYFRLTVIDPRNNDDWQNSFNAYKPGSQYEYCNLCFNMLGAVIEKITQKRFDDVIEERVLVPLGIKGGFHVDELNHDDLATIYHHNKDDGSFEESPGAYASPAEALKEYEIGYSAPVFSPTGGMKISALGLAKYAQMHMNYGRYEGGQLITETLSKVMQTPVLASSKYGLALRVDEEVIPGEQMVGHTGNAYGLYSAMFFEPEKKFGIVVITNGVNIKQEDGTNPFHKAMFSVLYNSFIATN